MMLKIILYAYTNLIFIHTILNCTRIHTYQWLSTKNISTFIYLRITLIQTQSYLYIIKFTFDTYIEQL